MVWAKKNGMPVSQTQALNWLRKWSSQKRALAVFSPFFCEAQFLYIDVILVRLKTVIFTPFENYDTHKS
jgi:hypothetical protein